MFASRRRSVVPAALGAAALLVSGCGNSDTGPGTNTQVDITSTEKTCDVANTKLESGTVAFHILNAGTDATEVYVYGQNGQEFNRVVDEVENIGPNTSRDLSVKLEPGTYEVVCKPGQTGDGIRTPITVTKSGN